MNPSHGLSWEKSGEQEGGFATLFILTGKLTKNNIKKTYNSDTAFNNVINDIASNIADGESANFSFLIDKRDYYFGYLSKYASNIYGGYFVSLGGVNYKFTSAIGAVEV